MKSQQASFPFQYAAFIGYASRSPKTCLDSYSRCPLKPGELLQMYAARGQPTIRVQDASAAVMMDPVSPMRQSGYHHHDETESSAASPWSNSVRKPTSGYDLLKDTLRDVLLGKKSIPKRRPSSATDDDGRAYITIQFSRR